MRSYKIISALSSKLKKVYKVESQGNVYILKEYKSVEEADREMSVAEKVALTGYAPKVIEREDNLVMYEYIEGENFFDVFKTATMTDDVEMMELLATRLTIFLQIIHSFTSKTMKEIDFNSYKVLDGRVVGVDFSQVDEGMPYEDAASAIAFALTNCVGEYYGCFPFIYKLLSCFKLEMTDVVNEVKYRLQQVTSKQTGTANVDLDVLIDGLVNFDRKGVDWRKLI